MQDLGECSESLFHCSGLEVAVRESSREVLRLSSWLSAWLCRCQATCYLTDFREMSPRRSST